MGGFLLELSSAMASQRLTVTALGAGQDRTNKLRLNRASSSVPALQPCTWSQKKCLLTTNRASISIFVALGKQRYDANELAPRAAGTGSEGFRFRTVHLAKAK